MRPPTSSTAGARSLSLAFEALICSRASATSRAQNSGNADPPGSPPVSALHSQTLRLAYATAAAARSGLQRLMLVMLVLAAYSDDMPSLLKGVPGNRDVDFAVDSSSS